MEILHNNATGEILGYDATGEILGYDATGEILGYDATGDILQNDCDSPFCNFISNIPPMKLLFIAVLVGGAYLLFLKTK